MTRSQRNTLQSTLRMLGIQTRDIGLILKDLDRWIESSGLEWTIQRLKDLRTAYLSYLGGNTYTLSNFANRQQNGSRIPKGVWGKFWTREEIRVPVSLKVYHIYSLFVLDQVTPKQRDKFLDSCEASVVSPKDITVIRNVRNYASGFAFSAKPYRRSLTQNVNALSPRHQAKFPKDFGRAIDHIYASSWDLGDLYQSWGGFERWFSKETPRPSNGLVGNLGITQERGGKLRVFAFPNLLFQVMLNPMKASLLRILKRIPEDCTFDQQLGVEWVRTQMQTGRKIWSVDLSDATNHFPFDLQRIALESIFLGAEWETHLQLWEAVSKGKYGANALGRPYVHWTKGQPLGTGPSFPAFAITHHAILHHCKVVSGKAGVDCYRILGDDIVISDESVYNTYRGVLASFECPVSEAKTMVSHDIAEFAGQVIYKGTAYPSTKWKDIHMGNLTNDAWLFKERGVYSLPKGHWKQWYLDWYSTYLHNSLGLTRDQRTSREASVLLFREEQRCKRYRAVVRKTFQQLYYSILYEDESFDTSESSTPDQEVRLDLDPYGFASAKIPVATFAAKFGTKTYASEVDLRVRFNKYRLGELRNYRDALNSTELEAARSGH